MGTRGGLNDRQKAFCREYIQDFHKTNAAKRAGYSEKTAYSIGSELLKKPEIQTEISRLTDELVGTEKASLRYIVLKLTKEIAVTARQAVDADGDPILDERGEPVMEYTSSDRDRLKALENLGRYAGMDQLDKNPITINNYAGMSREQALEEVKRLESQLEKS